MRAIILAGGLGTRLAGYPKSLIPFGTWKLIDLQLAALRAVGIEKPIVIGGPGGEAIKGRVGGDAFLMVSQPGSRNALIVGMRAAGRGNVLIVHGDVLFHPGVLDGILTSGAPCACLIRPGTESGKPQARVIDGRVVELGGQGDCTYMGIVRLSAEVAEYALSQCYASAADDYMDPVSSALCEHPCEPVDVGRFPIVDIDTQQDSLLAHWDVFPKVKAGLGLL